MHVPLVIRSPGLEPGEESGLSQHIDIPPTVLGLMGLPPHPSFQGVDLLATSAGEPAERSVYLVGQALEDQYALVEDRWKLIFDAGLGEYLLFDLEADSGELEDLAMKRPEIAARLATRLQGWRKAQLQYYSDPAAYQSTYPPRMRGVR